MKPAFLKLIICSATVLFSLQLKAQRSYLFFARGQYSIPLNPNISNMYTHAFGAEAGAGVGFDDTFFYLSVSRNRFKEKESVTTGSLTMTPLRVGVRQYIIPNSIYIHGSGGIVWISNRTIPTESSFNISAGVGAQLSLIEIEAAYEGANNKKPIGWGSWLGLKVGVAVFKH